MKTFLTLLLCLAFFALKAQGLSQDTLINENFEENPTSEMLLFPSGNDPQWVNYDADQISGSCVAPPDTTPFGWFWDRAFDVLESVPTDNDAFTSCSFLANAAKKNQNWLITSPITLPDASYWLCWRSLSYLGPGYVDGYKVLISTTGNDPATGAFSDTLFVAAEMVEDSHPTGSLDPADYVYSKGYLHANGYTDTTYFFVDDSQGAAFYHGRFEPHLVSLAAYEGKDVYIAFLHDSQDDFFLQVDDILVSNTHVATRNLHNVQYFNVMPNPVRDMAYFTWKTDRPQQCRLLLTDELGKTVRTQNFSPREEGRWNLDVQDLPPGIYYCLLETENGRAATKLVKL